MLGFARSWLGMGLEARQPDAAGAERANQRTGKTGRVFEDLSSPPLPEPGASTLTILQWNVRSRGNIILLR